MSLKRQWCVIQPLSLNSAALLISVSFCLLSPPPLKTYAGTIRNRAVRVQVWRARAPSLFFFFSFLSYLLSFYLFLCACVSDRLTVCLSALSLPRFLALLLSFFLSFFLSVCLFHQIKSIHRPVKRLDSIRDSFSFSLSFSLFSSSSFSSSPSASPSLYFIFMISLSLLLPPLISKHLGFTLDFYSWLFVLLNIIFLPLLVSLLPLLLLLFSFWRVLSFFLSLSLSFSLTLCMLLSNFYTGL